MLGGQADMGSGDGEVLVPKDADLSISDNGVMKVAFLQLIMDCWLLKLWEQ